MGFLSSRTTPMVDRHDANDISRLLWLYFHKKYLTGEDRLKTQFNRELYIPLRRAVEKVPYRRKYVFL